jgi:hypothetical protein
MPDGSRERRDCRGRHRRRGRLGSRIRGAAVVAEHEPGDEADDDRERENRSHAKARLERGRGARHPSAPEERSAPRPGSSSYVDVV